ncbi:unnamed protein product [Triticum turgidum subsp. durum]|uniref:F-box domain-containing protein n=1 Tax=Triticum turgidum subsp. durum TaxID=4567 RepID=A0A9R0R500_TRITD|nr:unnamed protein product [Triticum turgidum subsp. durum]
MDRLLPDGVLADILRRLQPRSLALSRCVCKCLRDIVDDHRLLHADLLPLSLGKIVANFEGMEISEFFYPVKGPAAISHRHSTLSGIIVDHCNGLLLLKFVDVYVVNPVTLQWTLLPPPPSPLAEMKAFYLMNGVRYLVFDPLVAPHYEVFLIPHVPWRDELGLLSQELEWPPSPFILLVYSSRTKHWEERPFVRKGDAMGSIADVLQAGKREKHYGVYMHGALYVHCQNHHFYKISLSDGQYQVIKPLPGIGTSDRCQVYLGKSRDEVRCAIVDCPYQLRVWMMDESYGQYEWVLKHHIDLMHVMQRQDNQQVDRPSSLQEERECYYDDDDVSTHTVKGPEESDYDFFMRAHLKLGPAAKKTRREYCHIAFLGFHPFDKDVVFLTDGSRQGFAYHLESYRVEHLEKITRWTEPVFHNTQAFVNESFPFTPCLTGELSRDM